MLHKPWDILQNYDPEVYSHIEAEFQRQNHGLELIASENFASPQVLSACANVFSNKYAEGLPKKRYYGGCAAVDRLETLAIQRACKAFGAEFANVQPHSGAQANAAALLALCQPGDHILGLDLSHGGHLTHGSPANFSGQLYNPHFYGVESDGRIAMDQVETIAKKCKPKVIIAGGSAYPRFWDFKAFREIADQVGAYLLVDMAHIAGLVAAKLHPNPLPAAHVLTTTTHKTLRGPRGGLILWNEPDLSKILNKGVFPGTQGGPLEHIIAAKAVCFKEAMTTDFTTYQKLVLSNCQALADSLKNYDFNLVSGGSDNHLLLINLGEKVSGKELEQALDKVGITVNKNTVPGEQRSPFVTSGIRLGTPAVSSRGMGSQEMEKIAGFIRQIAAAPQADHQQIATEVTSLAAAFPLYPEWG